MNNEKEGIGSGFRPCLSDHHVPGYQRLSYFGNYFWVKYFTASHIARSTLSFTTVSFTFRYLDLILDVVLGNSNFMHMHFWETFIHTSYLIRCIFISSRFPHTFHELKMCNSNLFFSSPPRYYSIIQ